MTAETKPSPAPDPEEPPKTSRITQGVGAFATLALAVGVVGVILFYGYQARPGWVGVADKKFWDYLELLIVPAALALGVYWLNRAQQERERKAEDAQRERELEVENQRAQDEALQAYFDQIGQLLLDKDRPLRQSKGGDDGPIFARALTLTVLERLDGKRKGRVLRFLYEADLINKRHVVVDLMRADLRGADLTKMNLGAHLRLVDLSGADLSGSLMGQTVLEHADLSQANLRGLLNWTSNQLLPADSFEGATMPDGQIHKSDDNPDGPTLEEWLESKGPEEGRIFKSKSPTEDGKNSNPS
jgi:hypothetical protein